MDINSEAVHAELERASSASKQAEASRGNADFGLFVADLTHDQVMFRRVDHQLREAAEAFARSCFPVFYTANLTVTSDLPSQMAPWVTTAVTGKLGVVKILWVNLSAAADVDSHLRLMWAADRVSNELHSAPATSVAIIIQDNQNDDALRMRNDKVAELFSEAGRNLVVHDAVMVFRQLTVWASRQGTHPILVALPRSVHPSH